MRSSHNFSNQGLKAIPEESNRDAVSSLDLSQNRIKSLNNIEFFVNLRYINISQNNIADLSPLVMCTSLVEIDCSRNKITRLEPLCSLTKLKTLNASFNSIDNIEKPLPRSLISVDLSNNRFENFEFLQEKLSEELVNLDISGNGLSEIRSLRFIAVFQKLLTLNVGILSANKNLKIIQFVKHLCPQLEVFDGETCADVDVTDFFNADELLEVLVQGSESELRAMLANQTKNITWDEPEFVPFEADIPVTPLKNIDERLKKLEDKIPADDQFATPEKETQVSREELSEIKAEIAELREQVVKLSELLYVHDCAMKRLWESQ